MKRGVYLGPTVFIFVMLMVVLYLLYDNRSALLSAGKDHVADRLAKQLVKKLPDGCDKTEAHAMIKEFLLASVEQRLNGQRMGEVGKLFDALVKGKELTQDEADWLCRRLSADLYPF